MPKYTKKSLKKLLDDANILTTSDTIPALVILALDHNLINRDDVLTKVEKTPKQPVEEKRPVGRPRKYPPKEVDPNAVVDPKYHRLRTIRTNPRTVKLINVETGEETVYKSMYQLMKDTKHSYDYYRARDGCIVDGVKIKIIVD